MLKALAPWMRMQANPVDVSDGSPAAMDGIVLGDQLVKFGSVDGGDDLLMRLAREGQANEGRGLPVVVLRRGERVHLTVTPRRWPGRGLLGYGSFQKTLL
jgi:26S proteasome non-ATPase regulatory subunit 9